MNWNLFSLASIVVSLMMLMTPAAMAVEASFQADQTAEFPGPELVQDQGGQLATRIQELAGARDRLQVQIDAGVGNITESAAQVRHIETELEKLVPRARELENQTNFWIESAPDASNRAILEKNIDDIFNGLGLEPVGTPGGDVMLELETAYAEATDDLIRLRGNVRANFSDFESATTREAILSASARYQESLQVFNRKLGGAIRLGDLLGKDPNDLLSLTHAIVELEPLSAEEISTLVGQRTIIRDEAFKIAEPLSADMQDYVDAVKRSQLPLTAEERAALAEALAPQTVDEAVEELAGDAIRAQDYSPEPVLREIETAGVVDETALEKGLPAQSKSTWTKIKEKAPQYRTQFKDWLKTNYGRLRELKTKIKNSLGSLSERLSKIRRINKRLGAPSPEHDLSLEQVVERPQVLAEPAPQPMGSGETGVESRLMVPEKTLATPATDAVLATSERARLSGIVSELTQQLASANEAIDVLDAQINELLSQAPSDRPLNWRDTIADLEFQRNQLLEEKAALEADLKTYQDQLPAAIQQELLGRENAQLADVDQRVQRLQSQIETANTQIEEINARQARNELTGPEADRQLKEIRSKLNDSLAEQKELRDWFDQRKAAFEAKGGTYDPTAVAAEEVAPIQAVKIQTPEATASGTPPAPDKPTVRILTPEEQAALRAAGKLPEVRPLNATAPGPFTENDISESVAAFRSKGSVTPESPVPIPAATLSAVNDVAIGGQTTTSKGKLVWDILAKERHLPIWLVRAGKFTGEQVFWFGKTFVGKPVKGLVKYLVAKPVVWIANRIGIANPVKKGVNTVLVKPFKNVITKVGPGRIAKLKGWGKAFGKALLVVGVALEGLTLTDALINGRKTETTSAPIVTFIKGDIPSQEKTEFLVQLPFEDSSHESKDQIRIDIRPENNVFANDWKKIFDSHADQIDAMSDTGEAKFGRAIADASFSSAFADGLSALGSGANSFVDDVYGYYFAQDTVTGEWVPAGDFTADFDPATNKYVVPAPDFPEGEYRYAVFVQFAPLLLATGAADPASGKQWENYLKRLCADPGTSDCSLVNQLKKQGVISDADIAENFKAIHAGIDSDTGFFVQWGNSLAGWWDSVGYKFSKGTTDFSNGKYAWGTYNYASGVLLNGVLGLVGTVIPLSPTASRFGFVGISSARERLNEKVSMLESNDYWRVASMYGVPITGSFSISSTIGPTVSSLSSPQTNARLVALDGVALSFGPNAVKQLKDRKILPTLSNIQSAMTVTVGGSVHPVQFYSIADKPTLIIQGAKPGDSATLQFNFNSLDHQTYPTTVQAVFPSSRILFLDKFFDDQTPIPSVPSSGLRFTNILKGSNDTTDLISIQGTKASIQTFEPFVLKLDGIQQDKTDSSLLLAASSSSADSCKSVIEVANDPQILDDLRGKSFTYVLVTDVMVTGSLLKDAGKYVWSEIGSAWDDFFAAIRDRSKPGSSGSDSFTRAASSSGFDNRFLNPDSKQQIIFFGSFSSLAYADFKDKSLWKIQSIVDSKGADAGLTAGKTVRFIACQVKTEGEKFVSLGSLSEASLDVSFGTPQCKSLLECLGQLDHAIISQLFGWTG